MKDLSKVSRREFGKLAAAGLSLALPKGLLALDQKEAAGKARPQISADEALRQLLEGNARFVKGQPASPRRSPDDFRALAEAQYPEAVLVSCSDSRVAPEILFDVGVGDIFVVRVAGNVVSGAGVTVKGSIEYAVAELNVPLIMVLGHSGCGAVKAAMKHIDAKDSLPGAINGLVELIKPAVTQSKGQPGDALENAIRKNVEIGVAQLKQLDPILAPRVKEGKLKIVGAVYDLRNGAVTLVEPGKS
jgi:carbonic anhydrase